MLSAARMRALTHATYAQATVSDYAAIGGPAPPAADDPAGGDTAQRERVQGWRVAMAFSDSCKKPSVAAADDDVALAAPLTGGGSTEPTERTGAVGSTPVAGALPACVAPPAPRRTALEATAPVSTSLPLLPQPAAPQAGTAAMETITGFSDEVAAALVRVWLLHFPCTPMVKMYVCHQRDTQSAVCVQAVLAANNIVAPPSVGSTPGGSGASLAARMMTPALPLADAVPQLMPGTAGVTHVRASCPRAARQSFLVLLSCCVYTCGVHGASARSTCRRTAHAHRDLTSSELAEMPSDVRAVSCRHLVAVPWSTALQA